MTVYADVLFLINFLINFLLLSLTARIAHMKVSQKRLLLGTFVAALYAVCMFFPRLSFGYSASAKVLFSLFVVAITFRIRGLRLFLKTVGIFYLVTFAFGGSILAIFSFTGVGAALGAIMKNGIFYMNLPWKVLVASSLVSYAVLSVGARVFKSRIPRETLLQKVSISFLGKEVWLDALLDTGNALCEPFSGAPVIVAEREKLLPILPEALSTLRADTPPDEEVFSDETVRSRLRMIPFSSLGKEHGILIGFRPDSAKLLVNERLLDAGEVIVAIYEKHLAHDRSYAALLPPSVFSKEYI